MITVKDWKEITEFEPIKDGELDVDGTVSIIAKVQGKSKEEVEEMAISELLPCFLKCVHDINGEIFAKIDKIPKNGSGDGR